MQKLSCNFAATFYLLLMMPVSALAQKNIIEPELSLSPQLQWSRSLVPALEFRPEIPVLGSGKRESKTHLQAGREGEPMTSNSEERKDPLNRKWTILLSDKTLYRTMRRWAQEADYQLMWQIDRDYPIEVDVEINDDFRRALERVMAGVALTDYPLQAIVNPNARVLRVVRHQDEGRR